MGTTPNEFAVIAVDEENLREILEDERFSRFFARSDGGAGDGGGGGGPISGTQCSGTGGTIRPTDFNCGDSD